MIRTPRFRFVHYVLADNQNKDVAGPRAVEVSRGVWYGRIDSEESMAPVNGVRYFTTEGGKLVATNHPLWLNKLGRPFTRRNVPCR